MEDREFHIQNKNYLFLVAQLENQQGLLDFE